MHPRGHLSVSRHPRPVSRHPRPVSRHPRALVATLLALAALGAGCSGGSPGPGAATAGVRPSAGCTGSGTQTGAARSTTTDVRVAGAHPGSALVTVPAGPASRSRPAPLLVLFHGFGSDPGDFSTLTGLPSAGAARGWVVAVPHLQPGESGWNLSPTGSDAAFVTALVAQLDAAHCLDRRSRFLAGFSSGAAFAIAYGCSHEGQVAGLGTVAVDFQLGCRTPVALLAFHGTADPLVPYAEGAVGLSLPGVHVRGTRQNLADWAHLDRCRPVPDRVRLGSQVVRRTWSGCAPGTRLELVTVEGGGHTWPGADPSRGLGLTTRQISASAALLSFFAAVRADRRG